MNSIRECDMNHGTRSATGGPASIACAILAPSLHCQVRSDLEHQPVRRYCENIVVTQKNQINDMRGLSCVRFNDCGFAPGGRRAEQE